MFVDFTASWCLSCQVNERVALEQPEVRKAFAEHHVVLLKADWTRYDDSITQTLTSLGRSGVPTYVLYVPGESQPASCPRSSPPASSPMPSHSSHIPQPKACRPRPTTSEAPDISGLTF